MWIDGFGLDEEDGGEPLGESELIKVIFRDEPVVNRMQVVPHSQEPIVKF